MRVQVCLCCFGNILAHLKAHASMQKQELDTKSIKFSWKKSPESKIAAFFMNFFIHTNIHTYCLSQKCNWDSLKKNWNENIFSCNSNLAHNRLLFFAAVRIVFNFVLKVFLELHLVLKLSSINFCYLWQQLKIKRQP